MNLTMETVDLVKRYGPLTAVDKLNLRSALVVLSRVLAAIYILVFNFIAWYTLKRAQVTR